MDEARATGGEALAVALLELAEAEPLLGHGDDAVRAPLHEAAALLDALAMPALEGRALLRLAQVKLAANDLEGAEQLAARARDRLAGDADRLVEVGTVLARALIRRLDFDAAQKQLIATSDQLPDDPTTLAARRAGTTLALAWAELAIEEKQYANALERLDALAAGLAASFAEHGDELAEIQFTCMQARALVMLATGDQQGACNALRETVTIAKRLGALEAELESRVALAGMLVQRGDLIGRDEAERHLQITRDKALEHGLDSMHMAALVGQAGLMAKKGQTQAALARCLEIAHAAVTKRDLPRYAGAVALMSQIYEQKGDLASAYRTFAEANATLRDTLGDAAKDLIRPHLSAFADRIGHEKLGEIADKVNKAAHARLAFDHRS